MWDKAWVGTAGSARALFSAETGSWEMMVSCCPEVMMPASTRNWRFYDRSGCCIRVLLERRTFLMSPRDRFTMAFLKLSVMMDFLLRVL
tara:strand:- start:17141 stop:17407 length:267 start_codon:yes stop_codon:yes gene_type:complete